MSSVSDLKPLSRSAAVRSDEIGDWHTATHMRFENGQPSQYVVYCGASVPVMGTVQRDRQGIGADGRGYVCEACALAEASRH